MIQTVFLEGNWHPADVCTQCEPCFSVRLSGNLNKNCRQRNSSSALLRKELHKVLTKWMCPVLENMYIVHKIDPIVQIHICNFEQMPVSACLVKTNSSFIVEIVICNRICLVKLKSSTISRGRGCWSWGRSACAAG